MRKEIVEFVKNMRAETSLDELSSVCKNTEELCYVLDSLKRASFEKKETVLPFRLRVRVKKAFHGVAVDKITTKDVQIKLSVGYHTAVAIKDWLQKDKL